MGQFAVCRRGLLQRIVRFNRSLERRRSDRIRRRPSSSSMPPPVLVTVGRKIGTVGDAGNPFFHHRGPRLPLLRALLRAPSASGCGRPQRYGLLSGRPPASVVIVAAGQKIGSAPVRGIATWSQLHREPCSRLSPVVGDPKEKICEVTTNRNADLLVMGCRAIWLLKRMFLGRVSNYCINHVGCPIDYCCDQGGLEALS